VLAGIDHVQVSVPAGAEDVARAYWSGLLGLTELPKPPALAARGGCWFELPDGRQLHLGVEADRVPARKAHPAFTVHDVDAVAAAVGGAGYEVRWNTEALPRRRFFSDDPFGNRIEFTEPSTVP